MMWGKRGENGVWVARTSRRRFMWRGHDALYVALGKSSLAAYEAMTVTLYSITPPTSHTSRYLLRPTVLVAPPPRNDILDDIDSMYDQTLEDPVGLLEKSAEITRFP